MKKQLVLILLSFFFFGKAGAQNISSAERDSLYSVVNNLSAKIDKLEKELKYRSLYVDCMAFSMDVLISNNSLQHTISEISGAISKQNCRRSHYKMYCGLYEYFQKNYKKNKELTDKRQILFALSSARYHFSDAEIEMFSLYLQKAENAQEERKVLLDKMKAFLDLYEDCI